jgi:hypothetical protein
MGIALGTLALASVIAGATSIGVGDAVSGSCKMFGAGCPNTINESLTTNNSFRANVQDNIINSCSVSNTSAIKNVDIFIENSTLNASIAIGSTVDYKGAGCVINNLINNSVKNLIENNLNQNATLKPPPISLFNGKQTATLNQMVNNNTQVVMKTTAINKCSINNDSSISNLFLNIDNTKVNKSINIYSTIQSSGTCSIKNVVKQQSSTETLNNLSQDASIIGWFAQLLGALPKIIGFIIVVVILAIVVMIIVSLVKETMAKKRAEGVQNIGGTNKIPLTNPVAKAKPNVGQLNFENILRKELSEEPKLTSTVTKPATSVFRETGKQFLGAVRKGISTAGKEISGIAKEEIKSKNSPPPPSSPSVKTTKTKSNILSKVFTFAKKAAPEIEEGAELAA